MGIPTSFFRLASATVSELLKRLFMHSRNQCLVGACSQGAGLPVNGWGCGHGSLSPWQKSIIIREVRRRQGNWRGMSDNAGLQSQLCHLLVMGEPFAFLHLNFCI